MPRLFKRDYEHEKVLTSEVTPGCEWVLAGEGKATFKFDGTACLIMGGYLFARYDAKHGKAPPSEAIPCDSQPDPITKHWPHWVRVEDQPQYKWHKAAFAVFSGPDGTYELVGPGINSNKENRKVLELVKHGSIVCEDAPRDFEGLKAYLAHFNGEGLVFHHPDGRMCKIRRVDFGYPWPIV